MAIVQQMAYFYAYCFTVANVFKVTFNFITFLPFDLL